MLVEAQVSPMHPSLCGSSPFRLSRPAMRAPELAEGPDIRPFLFLGVQSFFIGQLQMLQKTPNSGASHFDPKRRQLFPQFRDRQIGLCRHQCPQLAFMFGQPVLLMAPNFRGRQWPVVCHCCMSLITQLAQTSKLRAATCLPGLPGQNRPHHAFP